MNVKSKILVVDDDAAVRRALIISLIDRGYNPIAADTGLEALDVVMREAPAVAIIDLKLGETSGLEVMREIKERSRSVECILLTGHASQASAIAAINLGAYGYVQKPYDPEQVMVIVRRAVEKQQAEKALRQYAAELEARNEELDAFAHTVAHDLKGPLNNVGGFAHLLERDYADMPEDDLVTCLQMIARSAEKMTQIINSLLLLASVRKEEVETELLDMAGIVAEAQGRLSGLIKERQAEVLLPDVWPAALGYGPWIEEVWVNYIGNAIRYGSQPSRVELGAEMLAGDRVRFWVSDNGPGIPPEEQARLFTPFVKLSQVRLKGYGLGLSVVRRIVEKLGGQVGVESVMGQGTVFGFTLPAVSNGG